MKNYSKIQKILAEINTDLNEKMKKNKKNPLNLSNFSIFTKILLLIPTLFVIVIWIFALIKSDNIISVLGMLCIFFIVISYHILLPFILEKHYNYLLSINRLLNSWIQPIDDIWSILKKNIHN